ncbi:conserved protein of unknown function [Burkholderia multivorans]
MMEASVGASSVGIVVGILVMAIAAVAMIAHYRRERRRAELLRNLDHHEWCRWSRSLHARLPVTKR